jgi:hypothetical protein
MQQELIIALTVILAVAVAYLVSERRAHSRGMDNRGKLNSDFIRANRAAQQTALRPDGPRHAEPLLRFFDQEVPARNSVQLGRPAATRAMSFLICQTEGRHFECYVLRSHR